MKELYFIASIEREWQWLPDKIFPFESTRLNDREPKILSRRGCLGAPVTRPGNLNFSEKQMR